MPEGRGRRAGGGLVEGAWIQLDSGSLCRGYVTVLTCCYGNLLLWWPVILWSHDSLYNRTNVMAWLWRLAVLRDFGLIYIAIMMTYDFHVKQWRRQFHVITQKTDMTAVEKKIKNVHEKCFLTCDVWQINFSYVQKTVKNRSEARKMRTIILFGRF